MEGDTTESLRYLDQDNTYAVVQVEGCTVRGLLDLGASLRVLGKGCRELVNKLNIWRPFQQHLHELNSLPWPIFQQQWRKYLPQKTFHLLSLKLCFEFMFLNLRWRFSLFIPISCLIQRFSVWTGSCHSDFWTAVCIGFIFPLFCIFSFFADQLFASAILYVNKNPLKIAMSAFSRTNQN